MVWYKLWELYLNAINCFDELKRDLTVLCLLDKNCWFVSAQPALAGSRKTNSKVLTSSFLAEAEIIES